MHIQPRIVPRGSALRPVLCVMAAGFALTACGRRAADAAADDSTQAEVNATVEPVAVQPFTVTLSALGVVQPRPEHVATLSAPAPTRVARVLVAFGAHVKQGDPVIEFERGTFQAAVTSAEAAVEVARLAQDRAQRLVSEGISPRKDLEQANAELAKARAESVAARRIADLAVLHAPIAGVVTKLNAVLGGSVDPSQVLIEIADPGSADVLLTLTVLDAAKIRAGSPVRLLAGTATDTVAVADGTVADVSGTVDSTSRGVSVRVKVTHSERDLRIGESLQAVVTAAVHAHAVTVPSDALVPEGDGFKVFVVDSASIAHATPVSIGGRSESVVEVTKGLAGGERIVVKGAFGVEDGAKIAAAKP
jgi:RND family efflux transporter MFP subunit